jgi:hypothetical protein
VSIAALPRSQNKRRTDYSQVDGFAIARERDRNCENHNDAENADVVTHEPTPEISCYCAAALGYRKACLYPDNFS